MSTYKIAFVCDDEQTISAHFGHAPLAVVVTLEDDREIARETRAKKHHAGEPHGHHHHESISLHDPGDHAHDDHDHHGHGSPADNFAAMSDCDVIIVRGIGHRGQAYAESQGKRLLLVDEASVEVALAAYCAGTLTHNPRRVH